MPTKNIMDIPSLVTEMTDTLSAIQSTLAALASAAPDHDQKLDELELRRDTTVRALLAAYAAESESLAQKRRQEREAIAAQRRREDEERERRRREEDEALAERERRQDEEREARLRERTRGLEEEIDELMEEVEVGARRGAEEAVGRLKGLEGRRKASLLRGMMEGRRADDEQELNQMLEEQLKVPPPLPVWETRPRKTRGEVLPKALDLESIKAMGTLSPRLPSPRGMAVPSIEEPAAASENTRAMTAGQEEHSPIIPLYRVASHSDAHVSSSQQHDADEQNHGHRMDLDSEPDAAGQVKIQVADMSTFEDEDTMVAEEHHSTNAPDTHQYSDKDSVYSDTSANDRQPTPHVDAKPSTSSTTVREVPSSDESSDLEYLPGAVQRESGFHVDSEIPVEPAPTPVDAAAEAAASRNYDFDDSSDSSDDYDDDDEDDRYHHHHPVLETIQEDARVEDKWPLPPQGLHGVEYERDDQGVESPTVHASALAVHAPAEEEVVRDDDSVGEDSEEEGEKKEEKHEVAPLPDQAPADTQIARDRDVDSHSDVDEEKPEEQPTIFASPMPIHGAAETALGPQDDIADLNSEADEEHHQKQLDRGRSPLPREFPTQLEDFAAPTSPNKDVEHAAATERSLSPASPSGGLHEDEHQEIGLGIQHQPVETLEANPAAADDSDNSHDEREMPATVPEATSYFPETKAPTKDHSAPAQDRHTETADFTSPILNELDQDAEVSEDERERVLEKLKAAALASKVVDDLPDIGFGGLAISPRSARGSLADTFDRMVPVDEESEDDDDLPVEETYSPEIKAVNFHNVDFGGGNGGPRSAVGSFVDPRSPVPAAEEFGGYEEEGDRPLGGLKAEVHSVGGTSPGSKPADIPDIDLHGLTPSPRSPVVESRRHSKMDPTDEDAEGEDTEDEDADGEEVREDAHIDDPNAVPPPLGSTNNVHEQHDEMAPSEVEVHPRETVAMSDSTNENSEDEREVSTDEPNETPLTPTHVESSATHLFRAGNPDHRDDAAHFGDPSPMTSLAVELGNFTMANDDDSVHVDSPTAETTDTAQRANVSPPPSPTINVDTPTMHISAVPEDLRDQSIDESLVKSIDESLEEVIRAKSPAVAADQTPSAEMKPHSFDDDEHYSDNDEADTKHVDTYAEDAETSWGKPGALESEADNDKLRVTTPPVEELVLTPTPSLKDERVAESELSVDDRLNQAGQLLANSSSDEESDADPYENDRMDDPQDKAAKSPDPEHDEAPAHPDLGPATMSIDAESPAFVTPLATADFRPGDDAADKHRNLADELEGADDDKDEDDGDYFVRDQDGHPGRVQDEDLRSMDSMLAHHDVTGVSPAGSVSNEHHDVHENEEMDMANSPAADDHSLSPVEATTTSPKLNPQDTDADSDLDYATPLPLDTTETEAEADHPTPLLTYSRPQTPSHNDDNAYTPRDVTNLPWNQSNNNTTHSSPPHSVTSTGSTISSAPPSRTPSPDVHDPAIYQHHTPHSSGPMMARSRGASVLTDPDHHHHHAEEEEEKAPGPGPGAVSSLWPGRDSASPAPAPAPAPAATSVFQRMRNVFEHGVAAPIRTSVGGESIGGGGGSNRGSVIENSPAQAHGRGASGGGGGLFGGYTVNQPPPVPSKEGLRRGSVGQGFFGGMGIGAGRRVDGREEEEGRGLSEGQEGEGGR